MSQKTRSERADEAVEAILEYLTDRRGLRQEWYNIGEETQDEIRSKWSNIIFKALSP